MDRLQLVCDDDKFVLYMGKEVYVADKAYLTNMRVSLTGPNGYADVDLTFKCVGFTGREKGKKRKMVKVSKRKFYLDE